MLTNGNVQQVMKHSLSYGFVISQPFSFYVDAYPMLQNEVIEETSVFSYGEHSNAVRVLQHKLNKLSYYDKKIDGEFGVLTEYALMKFQKENDLTVNGKADKKTVHTMLQIEREKYLKPLKSLNKTYHPGDKGKDIETIQNALYYFGYYKEEIDGIYGPMTDQALKAFQKDHGLEVKEEVNEKTIDAIYKAEPTKSASEVQEKNDTRKVLKTAEQESYDVNQLISNAKNYIGTPYVWGGTSPSGFDCSGYIQYIFKSIDIQLPRTVADIWNMTKPVDQLSIGDFVFYETYRAGPSHMGVYVGDGKFIHAGEARGVEISDMDLDYWKDRYLGAKRLMLVK